MLGLARALLSILAGLLVTSAAGADDTWRSPQRYELVAELDPARHQVRGQARITFTNTSRAPLAALVFHTYLNAFRDQESVFMRESGGTLRGATFEGRGSLVLRTLLIDGEPRLEHAESELVPGDHTQLRVGLARPLAPGASILIETRFEANLPPLFARSGHARGFYAVAQWFPKLAKLNPEGEFASFPYHALGEFHADFADYTLTVSTPAELDVVASGVRLGSELVEGRRLTRFRAQRVHDVALFAAQGYSLTSEVSDGVLVRYFAPPGYDAALPAHARVVRAGLRHFGRAFGPYPYPELTVVVPPRIAAGAAGMEYPSLIVTDGAWLPSAALPSLTGAFVTAHELAHQWFYGLLASDEVRHPVLDEGLSQWAALDLLRALEGPREGLGRLHFDRFELERLLTLRLARSTAPKLPAYEYTPGEYSASVYGRAALALESIRRAYGRDRFDRALALYAEAQRFGHPTPLELGAAFDASYGAPFAARVLVPLLLEGESTGVHLTRVEAEGEHGSYRTRVRARRTGNMALPTWVALHHRSGRELARMAWPAWQPAFDGDLRTEEPVARVVIDPDRALLLDDDQQDQCSFLERASARRSVAHGTAWLQLLLGWIGP